MSAFPVRRKNQDGLLVVRIGLVFFFFVCLLFAIALLSCHTVNGAVLQATSDLLDPLLKRRRPYSGGMIPRLLLSFSPRPSPLFLTNNFKNNY
ncbi:MAG: hypothetical protein D084_Lepto4C00405G0003 [Leptospirillum sp. Group IV 'UBA BS']|nr:MAG: hypothetical protein D084_Lepto4C00405G0003 [Leptospirillum sp. Group IV 'UBA BS']